MPPRLAVVDAAGAAERDTNAIAGDIPSRALMQRAGAAAAALLAETFADRLEHGVLVATGGGNNGGDGWVVAHALHAVGVPVRVVECVAAATPDARLEREVALGAGVAAEVREEALATGGERIVVDALLGTGFRVGGPLRGGVADAVARLHARRAQGAAIVALDIPSGVDASTGDDAGAVTAHLTVTFGTVKRGHLVARARCGRIVAVDIGLGAHAHRDGEARLASPAWFRASLPPIAADAHKGTRGKVVIIGGEVGLAGATILAARGALRSGAGMVRCVVAPESIRAVQEAEPPALTAPWPEDDAAMRRVVTDWADVVLVGPGLGREQARALTERLLANFAGPVVLDADALFAFSGDAAALQPLLAGRAALLTPHAVEFARLAAIGVEEVLARRFELPAELAARTGAAVLLKGLPTVVSGVRGDTTCVAEGTPVLATGGSGDVLGGIAATLLAQVEDPALAGALAAFAHGRAAHAVSARQVRGYTLDDVVRALPSVWTLEPPAPRPPVLADLPAVGEEAP
jgi:NAD(P)H-hydrate epimerase